MSQTKHLARGHLRQGTADDCSLLLILPVKVYHLVHAPLLPLYLYLSSQPSREVENILAHGSHRYSSDTSEANLLIPDWSPSLFDHAAAGGFTAGHSFIDRPYYYPNPINLPYDSSLDNEYYEAADAMVTALFIDSLETTTMSEQRNEQERPSTEQVQSLDVSTHDYVPSLDEDEQQR